LKTTHEVITMTSGSLLDACLSFEGIYGMPSRDFDDRFIRGEFVGIHDAYRWAGYWSAYLEIKGEASVPIKGASKELLSAAH